MADQRAREDANGQSANRGPTPYYEDDWVTIYNAKCEDVLPLISGETSGGSWDRPSRPRTDKSPTMAKTLWEAS